MIFHVLIGWMGSYVATKHATGFNSMLFEVGYERSAVTQLLSLLPRLAPVAWLADPGRPAADAFTEQARRRGWLVETRERGVVQLHTLRLG